MFYLNYLALELYWALKKADPKNTALNKIKLDTFSSDKPIFISEKSLLPIIIALNEIGFYQHSELKWIAEQVESFISEKLFSSPLQHKLLWSIHRGYVLNAPTLGDFIERIIDYFAFVNRSISFEVNKLSKQVEINFKFNNKEQDFNPLVGPLFYLAYSSQLYFGRDVKMDLFVPCNSQFDRETFRSYISGQIIDGDKCYLRVKMSDFNLINRNHNSHIDNELKSLFDSLKPPEPEFDHIKDFVLTKIEIFFIQTNNYISADEMANLFQMSKSSFYRKLASENTSYRELVESVREKIALKLIRERAISFGEISDKLGYANLTGFNRAFKRWFGICPSEYRHDLGV